MFKNPLYINSIAIIFKENKVIGWMSTFQEADLYCKKYHEFSWDFYSHHKDYVHLYELKAMTLYDYPC